jgi:CBS domain-containing protein
MRVRDIMTRRVISAAPDTSVLDAAALLVDNGISGVPVVDRDAVVGMVSEADLLHRHELGSARDAASLPWWRRLFAGEDEAAIYVEAHATKVGDIMSRPVVSVVESMPVGELAALLEAHNIRRAPVLDSGSMVGIVSRADFVRALVNRARVRPTGPRSDETIRRELLTALTAQGWWRPALCDVTVADGVVHVTGVIGSMQEKVATRVVAENIAGVRGVEDDRSLEIPAGGYL